MFADMIGVAVQQIQKYEHGLNRLSASRLQQITIALKVTPASFSMEHQQSAVGLRRRIALRSLLPCQRAKPGSFLRPLIEYARPLSDR
jgi:transcriptional regulator with XRE-family HTH domain